MGETGLLPALAATVKEARIASGRKNSHFAAAANADQSTMTRFEQGRAWPRDPDSIVRGYATVLGVQPADLWCEALRRMRAAAEPNGAAPQ